MEAAIAMSIEKPNSGAKSGYSEFQLSSISSELERLLRLDSPNSKTDKGEACERLVATLLLAMGHRVKPTKDASVDGAPISQSLTTSLRLPDFELEVEDGYVEAKWRKRPHIVYSDTDPFAAAIPIGVEPMEDYITRAKSEDTTVYLFIWDNENKRPICAEARELDGNEVKTDVIDGDRVYLYDYDDFEPVSPFASPIDKN